MEKMPCTPDTAREIALACGLAPDAFAYGAGAGLALAGKGEGGSPATVLCRRRGADGGVYLFAGCTRPEERRRGHMTALLETAAEGAPWAAATLAFGGADFLARRGFTLPLTRRRVRLYIEPDLFARGEADAMTAAAWARRHRGNTGETRGLLLPAEEEYTALQRLFYAAGATFLESGGAWGIYFVNRGEDRLFFPELFAPSDREATALLAAARNRTGVFHAEILLPGESELLLGEGVKETAALVRPGPGCKGEGPRLLPWL